METGLLTNVAYPMDGPHLHVWKVHRHVIFTNVPEGLEPQKPMECICPLKH